MKCLFLFVTTVSITACAGLAQQVNKYQQRADSAHVTISLFEDNRDGSVYTGMYEILKGMQPVNYVGVTYFKGLQRPHALREGEGKNGYVFEANLDQVFTLAQGRTGGRDFWQRSRLAVRYAPALRMANDSSLPLVPTNQKIGFEYSYALWNNYTNRDSLRANALFYSKDIDWVNTTAPFKVVHLMVQAMHFSNGQAPGVFFRTSPVKRNDYLKGDFSTNYVSVMAVYSRYNKTHALFSAGGGFRQDGEVGGALSFTPEQQQRYGRLRLLGLLQYRTKPVWFGRLLPYTDLQTGKEYAVRNKVSFRHRVETEYILGNLRNFDRDQKYRLGLHYFFEVDFAKSRTAGLVLHLYHGRDYLNIRYDDVVTGGNLGISFTLMKYKPPRQKSSEFIVAPARIEYDKIKRKDAFVK